MHTLGYLEMCSGCCFAQTRETQCKFVLGRYFPMLTGTYQQTPLLLTSAN